MAMSAGAAGLMAAGGVLSSAIGMVAANHGAFKQYKYNSKLQKEAAALNYKYGKKNALNSPTWNRQGLESAGYNPMLAVQNGTAGTNSNWTSNSSVSAPDYSGLGVADAINNATRLQEMRNQTEQTKSQIDVNSATAENQLAEAANKRAENPYISKREEAQIRQTDANTTKLNADTELNKATIANMESRLQLDRELGFAGLDVARRGQDLNYASSIYGSDAVKYAARKSAFANVYNANTMKEIADTHSPSGRSSSFRNYAGGVSDLIGAALHGTNNYYEGEEHTYDYDRNGKLTHEKHKGTSGKKGKRK